MKLCLPENHLLANKLDRELKAMDVLVKQSVFAECALLAQSPPLEAEIDVILNDRFAVYIIPPREGAPATTPYCVIVHEPGQERAYIAGFLSFHPVSKTAAKIAARAINQPLQSFFP